MKYVKPDDIILELGGNIGRVSSILSTIIKSDNNLLVLECSPVHYKELLENRDNNGFTFNVEGKALSSQKLYQFGWNTYTEEELEKYSNSGDATEVETITLDEIRNKYKLYFNTLIIDCEGAFYYIIQSFPSILDNIEKIIIENDYPNWERKMFVEEILQKAGFETVEIVELDEIHWADHTDPNIQKHFYEVKIRNK